MPSVSHSIVVAATSAPYQTPLGFRGSHVSVSNPGLGPSFALGSGFMMGEQRSSNRYARALSLARQNQTESARLAFLEATDEDPHDVKCWISFAQMEKRTETGEDDRFQRCRLVLQKGLTQNPSSAQLCQAWGLMELQRGNFWAALALLERASTFDPARCAPVLRWKPVQLAKAAVTTRQRLSSARS